jgi:hypothetical protein
LYEDDEGQAEREAARIERDVERRRVASVDEVLVELVAARVEDPDHEGRQQAAERAVEKDAEDRVLGDVSALAERLVPGAEAARERRDRGQTEDHAGPKNDRRPEAESAAQGHRRAMIGSAHLGERKGNPV